MKGFKCLAPPQITVHIEAEGMSFDSAKLSIGPDSLTLSDPFNESPSSRAALEAMGFNRIEDVPTVRPWAAEQLGLDAKELQRRSTVIRYCCAGSRAREFYDRFVHEQ